MSPEVPEPFDEFTGPLDRQPDQPTPFEKQALSDINNECDHAHRLINGGFSKNEAWELVKSIRDKPTPLGG